MLFADARSALPHENLWILRNEQIDHTVREYYSDPVGTPFPGVFITFPCMHDPSWSTRFPKISNAIVIAEAPYDLFEKWREGVIIRCDM